MVSLSGDDLPQDPPHDLSGPGLWEIGNEEDSLGGGEGTDDLRKKGERKSERVRSGGGNEERNTSVAHLSDLEGKLLEEIGLLVSLEVELGLHGD